MQQLTHEEKAKRGVIAVLAYEILEGYIARKSAGRTVKKYMGEKKLIETLAKEKIIVTSFEDGRKSYEPGILTSDIMAIEFNPEARLIPRERPRSTSEIANPFASEENAVKAALAQMVADGLITSKSMHSGKAPTTRYVLNQAGVDYLNTYDPALAQKVAQRLGIEIGNSPPSASAEEIKEAQKFLQEGVHITPGRKWSEIVISPPVPRER